MAFDLKNAVGKFEKEIYARMQYVRQMNEEHSVKRCLRCDKNFASFGRFHRVCRDCHATPSYRGASQILDFCS